VSGGPQPFPLPSDTRHLNIESRQYKLLGVDLGHGWPRAAFKVGAWFFLPWLFLCWRVLQLPLLQNGMLLVWLGPPLLLTRVAFTKDAGGRYRVYAWLDRLGYLTRRPKPIVNGGLITPAAPRTIRSSIGFLVTYDDAVAHVAENVRDDFPLTQTLADLDLTDGDPRGQVA